jgi:hypothetical protein
MSRLRERMQEDLKLAGLCHNTQQAYLRCVTKFSSYFGKSPTQLGSAQVRAFLGAARGGLWAQATASPTCTASVIDQ